MKIYTHYSESHRDLYEKYFKKSIRDLYTEDELVIRSASHKQTTRTGKFMEQGWLESMKYKLQVILQAIDENKDEYFIFSDVDIYYYNRFLDDLINGVQGYDIACQEDCGTLCAGFFIAKGNDNVKSLFMEVYRTFTTLVNDQVALNKHKDMVNYKLLDKEKYYTIGNFFNNKDGTHIWDNNSDIIPPSNMLMHHGNYVQGVDNKINLMQMVKANYENLV